MTIRPTPRPHECEKCSQTHNKCLAHNKDGNPCNRNPADGADVCPVHGGHAPQVRKAAEGRVLDRDARKLLQIEGYEPITDPFSQLSDIAGELVKLKDIMREKVEELTTLKDVGGDKVATQIDVVFSAYERALDRCERMLMGMARLDLEDRIARLHSRIDDAAAKTIIAAMVGALDAAEIQGTPRDVIMNEFASRLQPGGIAGSREAISA